MFRGDENSFLEYLTLEYNLTPANTAYPFGLDQLFVSTVQTTPPLYENILNPEISPPFLLEGYISEYVTFHNTECANSVVFLREATPFLSQ
jgi:hypothetical protein